MEVQRLPLTTIPFAARARRNARRTAPWFQLTPPIPSSSLRPHLRKTPSRACLALPAPAGHIGLSAHARVCSPDLRTVAILDPVRVPIRLDRVLARMRAGAPWTPRHRQSRERDPTHSITSRLRLPVLREHRNLRLSTPPREMRLTKGRARDDAGGPSGSLNCMVGRLAARIPWRFCFTSASQAHAHTLSLWIFGAISCPGLPSGHRVLHMASFHYRARTSTMPGYGHVHVPACPGEQSNPSRCFGVISSTLVLLKVGC